MPISVSEPISGFKTCARNQKRDGFCAGYDSVPAELIVETVSRTFIDYGGDDARVENSFEYLHPATVGKDDVCDSCGGPVSLSFERRPEYERLAGPSPTDIVRTAHTERERDQSMVSAAERSAGAQEQTAVMQEQANALLARQVAAAERANELEALRLGIEPEPRPSDVAPRHKRVTT